MLCELICSNTSCPYSNLVQTDSFDVHVRIVGECRLQIKLPSWLPSSLLRLMTDSNLGGVEKLCVCLPAHGMCGSRPQISAAGVSQAEGSEGMIPPLGLLLVKGWTRSLAAHCVMFHCYECNEFLEARLSQCELATLRCSSWMIILSQSLMSVVGI